MPPPDPSLQTVEPVQPGDTTQPQNISLDMKIDNFLIQYERESAPISGARVQQLPPLPEGRLRKNKIYNFLFEADDEPPPDDDAPPDPPAGGDDPFGGGGGGEPPPGGDVDPSGGGSPPDGASAPSPPPVPVPRINIRKMAPSIARLVSNYDALLDPKTVILNRVQAYMQKNYDANVAKELMQVLELNFGLKPRVANLGQSMNPGMGAGIGDLSDNSSSGGSGVSSGT